MEGHHELTLCPCGEANHHVDKNTLKIKAVGCFAHGLYFFYIRPKFKKENTQNYWRFNMRSIVAGIVVKLHDVIRDTIKSIKSGDDPEAAGMASTWFEQVESTNFEDVNFNEDVYSKMQSKKTIPAGMSYFTFRNHFIKKVLVPLREAILEFLMKEDSNLKRDRDELDWLNGLLKNYVTVASVNRAISILKTKYANRAYELLEGYKWYEKHFSNY